MEQHILDFISAVFQAIGWPGVVLMMTIESACIPLPSEIIMPLASWILIVQKGLGWQYIFLAGVCGAVGNIIGSAVSYWAGARGGRPLIKRFGKYVLISEHELDNADRWFARYGDRAAFFSRLLPGVRTFISLPAGIARASRVRFFAYTFIGSLIWSTALAYGGYLLGSNWEVIRRVISPFDLPIAIVFVLLAAYFVWRRIKSLRVHNNSSDKGNDN